MVTVDVKNAILRKIILLARSAFARRFLRFGLAHMTFAIPVHRLRETATLLAFPHPQPSYAVHILIVPKQAYASLLDLPAQECAFLQDLFATVQSLVREMGLDESGYRLIANGGAYQDVPILHFHLVSDKH